MFRSNFNRHPGPLTVKDERNRVALNFPWFNVAGELDVFHDRLVNTRLAPCAESKALNDSQLCSERNLLERQRRLHTRDGYVLVVVEQIFVQRGRVLILLSDFRNVARRGNIAEAPTF